MLNNIKKRLSGSIKRRLYLLTGIVGVIMLIMVLVFIWSSNTLTLITAIARFERSHTIARVEAFHFLDKYYDHKDTSDLKSFTEKWAITQSYHRVFGNLLEMRTTKSKKEFADIVEKTFAEADRNMSEILVNRIHLLYWHPLIIGMVDNARKAHKLGQILDDHVEIILGSDSEAINSAAFKEVERIAESFRILEEDFTAKSGALGTEIAFIIKLLSTGMLLLSVGLTSLVAFLTIRSISIPIGRFIAYSKEVAGGNIDVEMPEISGDELLSLSESMSILLSLNQRLKHEIEKKTQMANALLESEGRYRTLIMNLEAGILVHASDTSIVMNNHRASELLGLSDDQLKGKTAIDPDWKFVNEDNTPLALEDYPVNCVITSKKPISTQILGIHRPETKDIIWVTVNGFPMYDSTGSFSEIVISFFDVTRRKQAAEQIKANLMEKETLLHEIHHRVKNNMQVINSLLKLQSNNIEDEQIKNILKDSQSRVYAMSAVHETLHGSENLSKIDLKGYLPKVTTSIFQTYSTDHRKVKLNSNIDESPIAINQAYPLGLVINELISNSLKYAFPDEREGEISVSIKKLDNKLELTVADDGIGMPDGFDWKNSKSLGLKLVRTLVENQLDGSIDMENINGTKFTIKFNIET